MPYPSQINHQQILVTARELVETRGAEQFSLAAVAEKLGVKTPSLYRYVDNKTDLLRQVNLAFLEGLFAVMEEALAEAPDEPGDRLLAVLRAYRAYAHAHPKAYQMAFTYRVDDLRPEEDLLVQMVLPLQEAMIAISGREQALAALRGALAFVHGFVMLELTHQLRRGGDLDAHFNQAAEAYLKGWDYE